MSTPALPAVEELEAELLSLHRAASGPFDPGGFVRLWLYENRWRFAVADLPEQRGFSEGVTGAVGAVVSAVTGAVGSAIDAAKDVLGIHSPSKVFAEIGDNTAQGYVQGIEGGTPEAQGSMARMVSPADSAAAATSTASAAQAGAEAASTTSRGASFDFAGATFNFSGVANAETARDRFSELLTSLLEGDADSLNGAQTA